MIFSEFFYHSFPSYESLYKQGTKSMDKGFEIADIIVAFIKGDATPEQIVRLDEWQNESDENKRLGLFHCMMKQILNCKYGYGRN